jgi:hypothetical protein
MSRFVRTGFRRALLLFATIALATTGVVTLVGVAEGTNPTSGPPTFSSGPATIDHFGCYFASNVSTTTAPAPTFKIPPAVELANQFSPGFFSPVGRLVFHCNPTQKTTPAGTVSPIVNPYTHMACFGLPTLNPATTPGSALPQPYTVQVTNQFGTGRLTTGQSRLLCLPTWKNLPAAVALSQPPGLDHYVCYAVTNANMPTPPPLKLQDQFNTALSPPSTTTAFLGAPNFMCLPSLKNPVNSLVGGLPGKLFHPEAHLVCYPVVRSINSPPAPGGSVTDQNQFGIGKVVTKLLAEVCVPSFKDIVQPSNTLVITKLGGDAASGVGIPLSGATFTAIPATLGNPLGTCTTDASGTCQITGLAQDTYTVDESTPPPGYSGSPGQTVTFTTSPQTLALTFTDSLPQGTNTINITKLTNPNSAGGGGAPLAGATFTAVGALATSPTGTCTTDPSGTCSITGLAIDTYTVSETVPPPGFGPAAPQNVTFTAAPQTMSLTFFDSPPPTGPTNSIVVKKFGTSATAGSVPLAGATFVATPANPANPSGTCTTPATGMCTITGLGVDTYTVAETVAPPGWVGGGPQTLTFTLLPQSLTLVFVDQKAAGTP